MALPRMAGKHALGRSTDGRAAAGQGPGGRPAMEKRCQSDQVSHMFTQTSVPLRQVIKVLSMRMAPWDE